MKIFLSFFLLIIMWISAGAQKNGKYTIVGTFPDDSFNGSTIILRNESVSPYKLLDSVVVKKRQFIFKGTVDNEQQLYYIRTGEKIFPGRIILEPGKINVNFLNTSRYYPEVSGTPINDSLNKYIIVPINRWRERDTINRKVREAGMKVGTWTYNDERKWNAKFPKDYYDLFREYQNKEKDFIRMYAGSYFVEDFLKTKAITDTAFLNELLPQLLPDVRKRLIDEKVNWVKRLEEYRKKNPPSSRSLIQEVIPDSVQVGKPYTDFKGMGLEGEMKTFSSLIEGKKLVLIDFWASWCGPCIEEMPVIAELYRQYKDKGLEIIGISSDRTDGPWKKAVEANNMVWQQLRSSGKEGNPNIIYEIPVIPYTILIDSEGTIAARRLRGEALTAKVAELMNE